MTYNNTETYQPFPLPTYNDIKDFMENVRATDVDMTHVVKKLTPRDSYDEPRAILSPLHHKDLVEVFHT